MQSELGEIDWFPGLERFLNKLEDIIEAHEKLAFLKPRSEDSTSFSEDMRRIWYLISDLDLNDFYLDLI